MGGPLLVRLCMCRFEEGVCRFRRLDYFAMLQEGCLPVVLHVLAKGAFGRAAVTAKLILYLCRLISPSSHSKAHWSEDLRITLNCHLLWICRNPRFVDPSCHGVFS